MYIMKNNLYDNEWLELIIEAKLLGIEKDEIRNFLMQMEAVNR